jgi:hypothetical protein
MNGSRAGENWAGYTRAENVPGEDGKPISREFAGLWPPGPANPTAAARAPGGQEQPSRTKVVGPPSKTGKRPSPQPVPAAKKKRRKKASQ